MGKIGHWKLRKNFEENLLHPWLAVMCSFCSFNCYTIRIDIDEFHDKSMVMASVVYMWLYFKVHKTGYEGRVLHSPGVYDIKWFLTPQLACLLFTTWCPFLHQLPWSSDSDMLVWVMREEVCMGCLKELHKMVIVFVWILDWKVYVYLLWACTVVFYHRSAEIFLLKTERKLALLTHFSQLNSYT